jgi:hypothetical protein
MSVRFPRASSAAARMNAPRIVRSFASTQCPELARKPSGCTPKPLHVIVNE